MTTNHSPTRAMGPHLRDSDETIVRLEARCEAQRYLLEDVAHELRTPLTIARGFLELQDVSDPADVVQTRSVVLEECGRMERLVNELVLLARSQQPDFVIRRPVDVGALLSRIHLKAQLLGERCWQLDGVVSQNVDIDEQRVTQAMLQLVTNAVRHTRADGRITLGAERTQGRHGDELRFWVQDDGEGVALGEQHHIFQRFYRGSSDGSGLGLAIVDAIARSHGGRVEVRSEPSQGATFSLIVPVQPKESAAVTPAVTPRSHDARA